ncbi:MAG: LemA family protein [Gammaproteobacteria bacterium]|nr:LemA family protein [Gammaproteobacteria bacterium]
MLYFVLTILVAIAYLIIIYNKMINLRNLFKNAYAQIDVQLKRRHELIPNLVESAKAYLKHESETLEAVIQARNQASRANIKAAANPLDSEAIKAVSSAEGILSGAMMKFFAVAEEYPELKANETIQNLMEELITTENKVTFSRQAYNDSVMQYETYTEQFPNNLVARQFSFKPATFLKIDNETEKLPVKISFG